MAAAELIRVGVIGTGFVARHFVQELERRRPRYALGRALTRRPVESCAGFPRPDALTRDLDALIEASDVVFECSGDVAHAALTIGRALDAGRPVVTLNAEFHVTVGSAFVGRGPLSEAEGDQPGCLAALHEEAVAMGFAPVAYVNMKGFLNRNPSVEEMTFWGRKQGYSLPMVTSFTDGTKVQIEQCLVANGLGAGIAREDLLGPETGDLKEAARIFARAADQLGRPVSDYILDRQLPHGVFVVARHDGQQAAALRTFKLGEGPEYVLMKPYCLVHLEVFKTIERMVRGDRPLLNNGAVPRIGVASVAKRELRPGERVERGGGGFDLRGICVNIKDRPGHLPICLANGLRVRRRIAPGEVVNLDDVDLPESAALEMWRAIEARALAAAAAVPPDAEVRAS